MALTERSRGAARMAVAACLSLTIASASMPSWAGPAEEERARQLFKQGGELADKGKFAEACPLFQQAHDLHSTGGTALRTAECYEKIGKYEQALALYQYIVDHRATEKVPERIPLAEQRIAALKQQLATQPAATATAPPVLTAPPVVTAAPTATPAPLVTATAPPIETAKPRSRALEITMLSAGGAVLGVGALLGGAAINKANEIKKACGPPIDPCPTQASAAAETKGVADGATFTISLGLAGVVTGVILFIVRSPSTPPAVKQAIGPDGITLRF